jgi:hypothetical protein
MARAMRRVVPVKDRQTEKRDGIVRRPGEPDADMPSDRPEHPGELAHPQDVTDFHGDADRDEAESVDEVGPTGSTPR